MKTGAGLGDRILLSGINLPKRRFRVLAEEGVVWLAQSLHFGWFRDLGGIAMGCDESFGGSEVW